MHIRFIYIVIVFFNYEIWKIYKINWYDIKYIA